METGIAPIKWTVQFIPQCLRQCPPFHNSQHPAAFHDLMRVSQTFVLFVTANTVIVNCAAPQTKKRRETATSDSSVIHSAHQGQTEILKFVCKHDCQHVNRSVTHCETVRRQKTRNKPTSH